MAIMGRSIREDMNARYDLVDESDLLAAVDRMTEVFSASAYLYVYQGGVNEGYVFDFFISKKRPCRGGYPATGLPPHSCNRLYLLQNIRSFHQPKIPRVTSGMSAE
jgi:hypothetical protein